MTFLNLEILTEKTREKYKLNLEIPKPNQATFGTRNLRSYGSKMWNPSPYCIKTSDNLNCTCRVCEHTISRQHTLIKHNT